MRRSAYFLAATVLVGGLVGAEKQIVLRHVALPTSKLLAGPTPGVIGRLNGFAAAMAVSPDTRYAAVLNDGYGSQENKAHQSIAIVDLNSNLVTDFPDDRLGEDAHQSYFVGLVFGSDGKELYASMGSVTDPTGEKPGDTGNGIAVYSFREGKISPERFLKIAPQSISGGKQVAFALRKTPAGTAIPYPAGLAVIPKQNGDELLIADNYSDNALLVDSSTGRVLHRFDFSNHEMVPSEFPYGVVVSKDGRRAWCSLWNASHVAELDLEKGIVTRLIPTVRPSDPNDPGSHPTALLLSPDEKLLYVALSNADVVGVLSAASGEMLGVLTRTGRESQPARGLYPAALAQSSDGKRLFVAYSGLNAVGVFDVSSFTADGEHHSQGDLGMIPTDWYPSGLAVVGDNLLIASSKGQGTGPDNGVSHLNSEKRRRDHPYIPTLLYGSIARLNYREVETQLASWTRQVETNNLFDGDAGRITFAKSGDPIRHVIYIIKENRTYDQVLGDLRVGDGDPSLNLYGMDITPNEHRLALQFGVLDNFYDSGEVSGDGHEWSTAATATDYNENTWQIAYRGKERTYDYQGMTADELPIEHNMPDVNAPSTGYIWDNVASHGLSYRDYGEFLSAVWCKGEGAPNPKEGAPSPLNADCSTSVVNKGDKLPSNVGEPHGGPSPWPWAVPLFKLVKPTKAVLRGHFDEKFPDFNTEYPDQLRADEFLNEFDGFVRAKKQGTGQELPAFVLLYLPDDHTHGTTPGKPRPAASVADNDLAVGRVVEAVSRSEYWEDTAIFILEDDAQDGADHVDAHRSIAFVISKYSPGSAQQPFVDHRFYTTVNMIHTIETLLGLPPMNHNDGYAPVMASLFSGAGNQAVFTADWKNRDNGLIYERNPQKGKDADKSSELDFSHPDQANPKVLNAILWRDRKGNAPVPAAKHLVVTGSAEPEAEE